MFTIAGVVFILLVTVLYLYLSFMASCVYCMLLEDKLNNLKMRSAPEEEIKQMSARVAFFDVRTPNGISPYFVFFPLCFLVDAIFVSIKSRHRRMMAFITKTRST